jgi:ribosome-associated toxin RatA of RatAB toxin-antitoxin module
MSLETIAREHVISGLSPKDLYEVVTDYACYPRIFPEFTGCKVLADDGRVVRVEFRARVVVEVRYVLEIVKDAQAFTTEWTFVEGEVVTDSRGGWKFVAEGDGTRIHYHAGISVRAPLPKFMINKIANGLMGTSIPNMFRALEAEARERVRRRAA